MSDRLLFEKKVHSQAELSRNYKMCDQVTEEMSTLKKKRREVQEELQMWKREVQKATLYKEKKRSTRSMSESDEACSITPLSPLFSLPTPSPMSSWSSPSAVRSVTPSSVDYPPFASTPLHSPSQRTEHLLTKSNSIIDILHDAHGTLLSTDSEREEDSIGEIQVSLTSLSGPRDIVKKNMEQS